MLDFMREHRAHVDKMQHLFVPTLRQACCLKIVDPEREEEELVKSVAAEVANIREMAGRPTPSSAN